MTLTEFLLARIAEDEAVAQAAQPGGWHAQGGGQVVLPTPWSRRPWQQNAVVHSPAATVGTQGQADAAHIARHDPTRVLAECEAKRQLIEQMSALADGSHLASSGGSLVVRGVGLRALATMAQPYANRPGYQKEWAL